LENHGLATVTDSLFADNEARGGSGNRGDGASFQFVGTAWGGGIATVGGNPSGSPVTLTLSNVTLRHNRAVGGAGNTAGTFLGTGQGGGLAASGHNPTRSSGGSTTTVSNSTITDNQAVGGQGVGGGDGGDGRGGGMANLLGAILTVSGSTLSGNQALGGAGGGAGSRGRGPGRRACPR